jgi:hypothetical protein
LIFNVEEKIKELKGKAEKTGANELIEECYYQVFIVINRKMDIIIVLTILPRLCFVLQLNVTSKKLLPEN